jgi:hypothetical protein
VILVVEVELSIVFMVGIGTSWQFMELLLIKSVQKATRKDPTIRKANEIKNANKTRIIF